jgi:hypothetical protein
MLFGHMSVWDGYASARVYPVGSLHLTYRIDANGPQRIRPKAFLPFPTSFIFTMFNAQYPQSSISEINNVSGDQHITTNIVNVTEEKATLALLRPAIRNEYHVPRCMDGTREGVFKEIDLWLNGVFDYIYSSIQSF